MTSKPDHKCKWEVLRDKIDAFKPSDYMPYYDGVVEDRGQCDDLLYDQHCANAAVSQALDGLYSAVEMVFASIEGHDAHLKGEAAQEILDGISQALGAPMDNQSIFDKAAKDALEDMSS